MESEKQIGECLDVSCNHYWAVGGWLPLSQNLIHVCDDVKTQLCLSHVAKGNNENTTENKVSCIKIFFVEWVSAER